MTATLTVNKASVTFGDVSIENIFYTKAPAPSVVIDTFASSSVQYEYSVNGVTFGALSELYNESGYIPEGDYWVRAYIPATDANIASGASSAVQFTVNKATPNKVTATFGSSKKDEAGLYYQNWLVHDSTSVKVYYDDVLVDVATAEFVGITFGGSESKYNFKITPVDTDNFEITTIGVTVSIRTVATIGHGGNTPGTTSFGTIEDALDVAATKSSAEVWVLPDTSHKLYIRRSVSIASGVKLILPYGESGDDYNSGDSTETTNNISLARDDDSLCMTWVYIDSGVTLTVNGTMIISGQISAGNTHKKYVGHTYGKHARVIMLDGAQINAEGTSSKEAVLKCYGYIFDGTNASGTVTMKQYSTLYQPFVICDYRNGGYLNSVNDAKDMYNLAPFTRFQLINIESLTVYEYGSKLIGVVNINTSLGTQNAMPVIISSTMSGRGAGVLTLTSREYSSIHSKYNRATDITQLDIYGGAQTNSLVIDKTLFKISTEDGVFPLSYLYNVTLNPAQGQVGEAEFTMGQAFKMLPGAVLTVNKGAYLNITGNLSIYDEFNESVVRITDGKEKTTQSYPKGKAPALLMVYGRLEATSIGGDVYADANGAVVKVNSGTSAITHEVLVYLDDDWSSEIRSIRTVVKSFKLHYVTEYDSNGNIVSTNKVGYIEVGNTYTSNSTTKTWEPATPVVMPQYIEIVVPDGYWIETSEAISSIDYTNNDVVFTTYDSRVDGNTVRVLPGAIVTFHLTKNYLFVESGATTSYTVTADKLPKDDNTVVWLASYTVPAIYYVPVLAIDNFSTLDSCTVTYNNLQSGNVEITVVATKSVTAIVGTATAKITVSGLQNSDSTFSGKATSGTLSTGTADGKTTYSASKKGILANAAVQVTVTIYADETTLSLEGA